MNEDGSAKVVPSGTGVNKKAVSHSIIENKLLEVKGQIRRNGQIIWEDPAYTLSDALAWLAATTAYR
jgi:hypothetical protein